MDNVEKDFGIWIRKKVNKNNIKIASTIKNEIEIIFDQYKTDQIMIIVNQALGINNEQHNFKISGCTRIMTRGIRSGQKCGKPLKNNPLFCGTHAPKECQVKNCNGNISNKSSTGTYCRKHISDEKTPISLTINKWNRMEHIPTGLLFNKDKKVFARQHYTGVVQDLIDDDFACISSFHFKIADKWVGLYQLYLINIGDKEVPSNPATIKGVMTIKNKPIINDKNEENEVYENIDYHIKLDHKF
jgi:hypothetical protein